MQLFPKLTNEPTVVLNKIVVKSGEFTEPNDVRALPRQPPKQRLIGSQ